MGRLLGIALALVTLAPPVPGASFGDPALATERADFRAAERALRAGDRTTYERLRATLTDYPLYPYLLYAELSRRPLTRSRARIEEFLREYADTPLAPRLRQRWLMALADRGRWREFIGADDPGLHGGTKLRCQRLRALLETGDRDRALAGVPDLWMVGHSQPSECDPAFRAWMKREPRLEELAWQRLGLAMAGGRVGLARYLQRKLDPGGRALASAWERLRRRPERVLDLMPHGASGPRAEEVLVYALRRLAYRDTEEAETLWHRVDERYGLSADANARVARALIAGYAAAADPRALDWLGRMADADIDEQTRARAIVVALRLGAWQRALDEIDGLGVENARRARWRYWRARGLEAIGRKRESESLYAGLARERGYYGFLAADRIGSEYRFGDHPAPVSEAAIDALESAPGPRRARELLALGRRVDARREWRTLVARLPARETVVAAKLAERWGWHGRAILTAARAPAAHDDLKLRFPIAFRDQVVRVAERRGLEPAWVLALVRQESAFIVDARSPKGALGLMQVMPATGRAVARRIGSPWRGRGTLVRPEVSLRLGSAYLRRMSARFGGHRALATAAYNAGPHRVRRWLPEDGAMDGDVWVEAIPFGETRSYVRRILAYTAVYQHRLGEPVTRLREHLRSVRFDAEG